jgi:LAO/AO transport system kinase
MTDMMVLLQLPNAGDDLQAIKKGIVELADMIVINKADLDPQLARHAQHTIRNALGIVRPASPNWRPPVLALSGLEGDGIAKFWGEVLRYRDTMQASGEFAARRRGQALDWMWTLIDARLRADFRAHPGVGAMLPATLDAVATGNLSPTIAAERLLTRARKD